MAGENLSSYNAMKESGRDARSMKGKKKEFSLSAVNSWRVSNTVKYPNNNTYHVFTLLCFL